MKLELKVLFLSGIAIICSSQILIALGFGVRTAPLVDLYATQLFVASVLTSPVVVSYIHKRSTSDSSSSNEIRIPSFTELLHGEDHEKLRTSFKAQLVREFCVENYLFYFEALNFEHAENRSDMSIARAAMDIYQEFLIKNGRNEINISARLSESIEDELRASIVDFDNINATFIDQRQSLFTRLFSGLDARDSVHKKRRESVAKLAIASRREDPTSTSEEMSVDTHRTDNLSIRTPVRADVFTHARDEIYELMRRDSYVSWKKAYRREHAS